MYVLYLFVLCVRNYNPLSMCLCILGGQIKGESEVNTTLIRRNTFDGSACVGVLASLSKCLLPSPCVFAFFQKWKSILKWIISGDIVTWFQRPNCKFTTAFLLMYVRTYIHVCLSNPVYHIIKIKLIITTLRFSKMQSKRKDLQRKFFKCFTLYQAVYCTFCFKKLRIVNNSLFFNSCQTKMMYSD